jgi:hypothetical protein
MRVYQRLGHRPHKGRRNPELKVSVQGIPCPQEELMIVMPKIPEGVKEDDEMVGGVNT